jgi:hypothetical protein
MDANMTPLKEEDAYPALPQDAHGWEKLVAERACLYNQQEHKIEAQIKERGTVNRLHRVKMLETLGKQ